MVGLRAGSERRVGKPPRPSVMAGLSCSSRPMTVRGRGLGVAQPALAGCFTGTNTNGQIVRTQARSSGLCPTIPPDRTIGLIGPICRDRTRCEGAQRRWPRRLSSNPGVENAGAHGSGISSRLGRRGRLNSKGKPGIRQASRVEPAVPEPLSRRLCLGGFSHAEGRPQPE